MTNDVKFLRRVTERISKPVVAVPFIALILGLVFFRPLIMSFLLITLGAVSIIYKRWVSIGIDLEFCSLCAVAIGVAYGATAGAISGGLSMMMALGLNGHALENPIFAIVKIMTVAGLGGLAAFAAGNLTLTAGIYTFVADAIFVAIALQTGGNTGKLLVFLFTHTPIVLYQLKLFLPTITAIL